MRARLALLALPLASCGGERLAQGWEIDRLRILAVRAEPAEPTPGDTVSFEALVVHPSYAIESVIWFGCLASEAGTYGCALDEELLEQLEGYDPDDPPSDEELAELYEELVELGLLGFEPGLPPSYTVPDDVLSELSEAERAEGLNLLLTLSATVSPSDRAFDESTDVELAFKRVPISEAETPNDNPDVASLSVDGQELPAGTTLELERCGCYEIEANLAEGTVEDYVYVNSDGEREERTEEPYFTWYATAGSPDMPWSLHPHGVTWQADTSADELSLWVVVRDRRGGMGWLEQRVVLQDPADPPERDEAGEPVCGLCPA